MVYFVKGNYYAYSIFMGEHSRERCYDFEILLDCDPLKLIDAIEKNFSDDHTVVKKIKIETIIKLS